MTEPNKPVLLIVDDDERVRSLVAAAAERCGEFTAVQRAPDGQVAIDVIWSALRSDPGAVPDLVLSDLCMPRMDGFELIRKLKQHPETCRIPVAIMTSSNRPNDRQDAEAAGCCAFFDKPLRYDDFVALVCSLPGLCCGPAAR
jgi:CheY-like chemotaxis protein